MHGSTRAVISGLEHLCSKLIGVKTRRKRLQKQIAKCERAFDRLLSQIRLDFDKDKNADATIKESD